MAAVYQKLTDTVVFSEDPEALIPSAAYAYPVQFKSPSGRYLLSNSSSQGSGHDLVIKLDPNDTITLTNVTLASLHQSDFIFA